MSDNRRAVEAGAPDDVENSNAKWVASHSFHFSHHFQAAQDGPILRRLSKPASEIFFERFLRSRRSTKSIGIKKN